MLESAKKIRLRYPVHAVLLLGLAWAFFALVVLPCALFMLPIIPLDPLFVVIVIGLGGLLSSAHEYARSVARPVERATLAARTDAEVRQTSPSQRAA